MDISADLSELTRCPVGLVSAGVKSILDIGRYLDYFYQMLFLVSIVGCRTLEYLASLWSCHRDLLCRDYMPSFAGNSWSSRLVLRQD